MKKTSVTKHCQKSWYISATARAEPDILKVLAILSDLSVRRSAVHWEDLKPFSKSEKEIRKKATVL